MKGRKRKPAYLSIVDGNPGKRKIRDDFPKPAASTPACPSHLSKNAKVEWRRIVKELQALSLVTLMDRAALAAYCQAYGRWVEAEEALTKHGSLVKSPNNYPMPSPYLAIANKAMEQMRAFLTEFGMTPASRMRLTGAGDGGKDDPVGKFF